MERAYEDAYRQFIEPVIGASEATGTRWRAHAQQASANRPLPTTSTFADVEVRLIECDRARSAEILRSWMKRF